MLQALMKQEGLLELLTKALKQTVIGCMLLV